MIEAVHRIGQKTAGAWGAHTATIDWCEDNYTHSYYIAEWYNTISNIPFILLGLYGAYSCLSPHLQPGGRPLPDGLRYAVANVGLMGIGIGSFIFHATLKWWAQVILDELPMIFVTSLMLYLVCADSERWQHGDRWKLKFGLAALPISVSAAYLYYPNPILHQVCFGIIELMVTYRTIILFKTAPPSVPAADLRAARHYILTGSLMFILAFTIWNVDNIFCDAWTALRTKFWGTEVGMRVEEWTGVGVLVGAVTQGHAWWHLFTGLGCARIAVGTTYLMLSRKHPGAFELTPPHFGLLPTVRWRIGAVVPEKGKGGGVNGNVKMDKWL